MDVDRNHRLRPATWQPSPHCDHRPDWAVPELVVIHCISLPEGEFGTGYPQVLFCDGLDGSEAPEFADLEGVRVAPHLLIERGGELTQFVAFNRRAWHAGQSSWRGRNGCNGFSIGIELEGAVASAYSAVQYEVLLDVLAALMRRYPRINASAIVGHNEIAPERKFDPGPHFNWSGVLAALYRR